MPGLTPTRRYADLVLDGRLDAFVEERRAKGRSWRHIAMDLWAATDEKVDVTYETLRKWYDAGEAA